MVSTFEAMSVMVAFAILVMLIIKCFLRKGIAKRGLAGYNNLRNKMTVCNGNAVFLHARTIWLPNIQSGRGSVW